MDANERLSALQADSAGQKVGEPVTPTSDPVPEEVMDELRRLRAEVAQLKRPKTTTGQVLAGKAVSEVGAYDKLFDDAESFEQVLGYLSGASSVCWSKRPTGEFDSTKAADLCDSASRRARQLIGIEMAEGFRASLAQIKADKEKGLSTQEALDARLEANKRLGESSGEGN